ncbi:uncharacterized protein TNCV_3150551 [Trichonephila clavipes]|nr:uncharacterized protein TNCV_3150551 [Trichonephila clavipes]
MDDPICYELRVISIAIGTSVKCCSPKSFPSFKTSLELSFSRIMHAHMLQRLFKTSVEYQHMQLLPWPAYSPDISSVEHVRYLFGRRLAHDPRLAASKDEFLLHIQAIWNSLPQEDIQNLLDSMARRTAALIAARGDRFHKDRILGDSSKKSNLQPPLRGSLETSSISPFTLSGVVSCT